MSFLEIPKTIVQRADSWIDNQMRIIVANFDGETKTAILKQLTTYGEDHQLANIKFHLSDNDFAGLDMALFKRVNPPAIINLKIISTIPDNEFAHFDWRNMEIAFNLFELYRFFDSHSAVRNAMKHFFKHELIHCFQKYYDIQYDQSNTPYPSKKKRYASGDKSCVFGLPRSQRFYLEHDYYSVKRREEYVKEMEQEWEEEDIGKTEEELISIAKQREAIIDGVVNGRYGTISTDIEFYPLLINIVSRLEEIDPLSRKETFLSLISGNTYHRSWWLERMFFITWENSDKALWRKAIKFVVKKLFDV
jgi:hypothetical protein